MGTGKTVTGRVLAERTGMELVDMDSLIEKRQG
ncbi:MAG: shikimate kinase, partial [Verrucomicrobiia bacterium]